MRLLPLLGRGSIALASAATLAACDSDTPTGVASPSPAVSASVASATGGSVAALPRTFVNTAVVAPTGRTITVKAGQNLQNAINSAAPGDVISVQAGATFTGNFQLPKKSGSGWITIRSSAHGSLPAGTRVGPAEATKMPKLVAPNGSAALRTAAGAHHYRLIGLEIRASTAVSSSNSLVEIGDGSGAQNTVAEIPTHIILDRSYVHGTSSQTVKRCIGLHSAHSAIIDSYVSDCHSKTQDSQAIGGWNGPGPYKIANNYLSGAGENIMFGGADPSISGMLPRDIEISRNHIHKPAAWKGKWLIKNLLELKIGQRVLVEGNVFENNWAAGQTGFAIVLKSTNQGGRATWSQTSDVTLRHNIIKNVAHGVNIAAKPEKYAAVKAARFVFTNNVWDRVGSGTYPGGRLFQVDAIAGLTIESNSAVSTHSALFLHGGRTSALVVRNNAFGKTNYPLLGDAKGTGKRALDHYAPGWIFTGNVLAGGSASSYPTGNWYPSTTASVGFASVSAGNLAISSASKYASAGVNYSTVTSKTSGVVRTYTR
ncbi:MAG TPA: hypothetical protein VHQ45_18800 [Gemmatimonadaceae bacterium]|nr:hypothetical protein [Gemmatimonadaceae bacterium]